MKRETRIGLLAVVAIVAMVIGYNFLKGREVFSSTNVYYVVYENVDQLAAGDLVTINGLRVGQVASATLNPENVKSILVGLRLEEDLPVPKDARALIKSDGLLGGKFIAIEFDRACSGADCAEDGDFLQAAQESVLAALLGDPADLEAYTSTLRESAGPIVDSLFTRIDTNSLGRTLANLEVTSRNLTLVTQRVDRLLARSSASLEGTLANVDRITGTIAGDDARLRSILANVDSATASLARLELEQTIAAAEATLAQVNQTLAASQGTLANLEAVSGAIERGDGALGKLINEDDIYVRLDRVATNLDLLLQDFRLNPKRYVNVSVFGKKQTDYVVPEEDPAGGQLAPDN